MPSGHSPQLPPREGWSFISKGPASGKGPWGNRKMDAGPRCPAPGPMGKVIGGAEAVFTLPGCDESPMKGPGTRMVERYAEVRVPDQQPSCRHPMKPG
jgi:hypothetical protein